MKAVVREHIQQLDVSLGGGIVSDKIRVDTIDNPMLVIGLGGTGIDALLRLKYQVNRRFKLPVDHLSKKRKEKPDNIEFIAFETNEHDRNKKYKGIGLDPVTEFVLLSNPEIGGVLQNRSILEPYITEWLSPELTITDGISGASGVRQAGRLLLFTKITQVVQTIEKKVKMLCEGTSKKLTVFLLSGISGGTGSGCFLDIAYIVRGILERDFGSAGVDKVNTLGYLFTPDVNLSNKSLSSHTRDYIMKNGYAALKELDYWMNADERGERFRQQYGSVLNVQSPMPPFNLCHLISATNLEGKALENAYDYCMNVTAENITNFMASEEKRSGEEFAIHDYISNIRTNINQMPKAYAANYQYNVIGASSAVLPIEEMTTYLAYRLFKKMEKMFTVAPTQEDAEKFARKLGIDIDSISRKFEERVPEPLPGYENSERMNYSNVISQQVVSVDHELEQGYLAKAREQYIKAKKQLPGELIAVFGDMIKRVFLHPQQGPFYASRLIQSDKGFCLMKMILSYVESLKANLESFPREIEGARETAHEKLGDARSAFISKEKKKNIYIEAKINEYQLLADQEKLEQMIEFYEELHRLLNAENNRIYSVFTEVLNTLNQIFEKNGDILINGGEESDRTGNKTYYWNIVNVPDIAKVIGNILEQKDADDLIRDFTSELLERSDQWVKEQELDIVSSISDFLSEKFGELITKSMEDFLVIKYGQDETLDRIVERKIASKLDDEAIPVFHLSNHLGNMHFPSWGFVSVPLKAPAILKGIKNYQDTAISGSRFTVKESEVKNRIFWLNTKNGIPLFVYTPLKVYEESYERTILEREGIGRHLVQTEKNNWAYLPSPIPEKSWGDTYENNRIKAYNAGIRRLFDRALAYGSIREKGSDSKTSSRYECIITKPFSLTSYLEENQLPKDSGKLSPGEIKRLLAELKGFMKDGLEGEFTRDIFGSTNEDMAKENLIRYPELIRLMQEEVRKYEEIEQKISELEQMVSAIQGEEELVTRFIEALYTGTLCKKGALYVYDKDEEEEAWDPFVNLMKVNRHVEYALFEQFRTLDAKKMAILNRKATKRSDAMTLAEDTTKLVQSLDEIAAAFQGTKNDLEYDRDDFVNGEELYRFYKKVWAKVNDMRKTLQ
ncbi:tubulin-like doman-containing protein [Brevibacillus choshinensis]|uniref:Tubulin-like doman-containing protein n=1 Tax=Brevibacillus choshinensis TaxID=54911 RepID=A0ABX7FRH0_BRECH|nr:tubulin-like doman-containing protein [Brevibacillus choshinensis]QRG67600.1 tubulin-like doman-containing protein [Brevibacillus choshinensis]